MSSQLETNGTPHAEAFETVVIGGGQAGLAVGYHLTRRNQQFVILDAGARVGDAWRSRWDSLRLFTPARYSGLPGMRFPAPGWTFPTKDEMGDYLESYADTFALPVRTGVSVERLSRDGDGYLLESAGGGRIHADRVVVASGAHRTPRVPPFSAELDPRIVQLHSGEYRNPGQLNDGPVLVAGVGNSGAEISFELSRSHDVMLSGRESGQIPARHGSLRFRLLVRVIRFLGYHVLTMRTPIGRRVGPKVAAQATPLIRVKSNDLTERGVERVPRVAGVRDGLPVLEDGRVLDVANIVWCTGFRHDLSWIDVPVLDEDGGPVHERGVATTSPGLYFAGLVFQFAAVSDVLPGIGRDAGYVGKHIAAQASTERAGSRRAGQRRDSAIEATAGAVPGDLAMRMSPVEGGT
jgi:putative flavoprotein involved in K+ transport